MKDSPETVLFAKLEDSMKLFYSSKSLKNQISYNFGMTQTLNIPKLISRKICVYFIIGQIIYHSNLGSTSTPTIFCNQISGFFFVRLLKNIFFFEIEIWLSLVIHQNFLKACMLATHRVEISWFFYQSDFTWNKFRGRYFWCHPRAHMVLSLCKIC